MSSIVGGGRIATNIPAESAYNALQAANVQISAHQLRLSTGKRVNGAEDDVVAFVVGRRLGIRNAALKSALNAVGDAKTVLNIAQAGLLQISDIVTQIKGAVSQAGSGSAGTSDKVQLARVASNLVDEIQSIVNETTFNGYKLLSNNFVSQAFLVGFTASNTLDTLDVSLSLNLDATSTSNTANDLTSFGGITSLDMRAFGQIVNYANTVGSGNLSSTELGALASSAVSSTLASLDAALNAINDQTSYIGALLTRLETKEVALSTNITNFNAAISRLMDADVAKEQLDLVKAQFLQQTSIISLAQANSAPQQYLKLFQ